MIFSLDAGGEVDGGTDLRFGFYSDVPPDLTIVTYPFCKASLLAINAIWQAPWACAQAFGSAPVMTPVNIGGVQGTRIDSVAPLPRDPTFPYSIFHIPWIAYLAKEFAAGVKLPPEILTERTRDGGLLMTATKERLDPDNPEHARRARILAETMIKQTGHPSGRRRPTPGCLKPNFSCFRLPPAVAAPELSRSKIATWASIGFAVAVLAGWVVEAAVKWAVGWVLSHFQ